MKLNISLLSIAQARVEASILAESVTAAFERSLKRLGAQAKAEIQTSGGKDPRFKAIQGFVLEDMRKKVIQALENKHGFVLNEYTRPVFLSHDLPESGQPLSITVLVYLLNANELSLPKDPAFDPQVLITDLPPQVLDHHLNAVNGSRDEGQRREGDSASIAAPVRKGTTAYNLSKSQITLEYLEYINSRKKGPV